MKKKPFFRITILCFLLLAFFTGVERLSYYLTDGFGLASISSDYPFNPNWDTPLEAEDIKAAENILSQPFSYLTSGSQSFVFKSDDNRYVIKFFKHKRWRISFLLSHFPFARKEKQNRFKKKKWETVNDTCLSCKLSYEKFKKDTAVVYIHLNQTTHLNRILVVKDRIGIKHKLKLDNLQFVIQKKAIPTDDYLLSLKRKNLHEKAKQAVHDILAFTTKRAKLGYSDKDPHSIRNFGFINGKVVEIDIGGFHHDPKKNFTYYQTKEIFRIRNKMLPWLRENYEEIVSYAENEINLIAIQN